MHILNNDFGITYGLYECRLAEPAARITNSHFIVTIPSLMTNLQEKAETPDNPNDPTGKKKLDIKSDLCLNEGVTAIQKNKLKKVEFETTVYAESIAAYPHRLDGFIKHFKLAKLHAVTGKIKNDEGNLSGPTTPAGCGPHTHETTGSHSRTQIEQNDLTWTQLDGYMMTQVDFENIHNKVIKKGHVMYGAFVNGQQNKFVIIAISNVIPRTKKATVNGKDVEIVDDTVDGEKNPKEEEA